MRRIESSRIDWVGLGWFEADLPKKSNSPHLTTPHRSHEPNVPKERRDKGRNKTVNTNTILLMLFFLLLVVVDVVIIVVVCPKFLIAEFQPKSVRSADLAKE